MAFVATDKDGREIISFFKPHRSTEYQGVWYCWGSEIKLPKGSIRKLIGRELTFDDKPVELKGE